MNWSLLFSNKPGANLRSSLLSVALLGACGPAALREPAYGMHPSAFEGVWVEVESPPPPVQPMEVPPAPSVRHVWIDGQWTYQRTVDKWTWEEGTWCTPPANAAFYAKPALRRFRKPVGRKARWNEIAKRFEEVDTGDDRWLWARGSWYLRDQAGNATPTPDPGTCVATETGGG